MFEDQKQFKKITQALCLTIIDVHKQTSLFGEIHYFITFLQLLKNKILVNPKYINSTEFIIDFFNGFTKNIYLSPMTNFSQSYFLGSVFFNKSLMNILQSNEISDLTIDVNEEFISNIKTNPTLTLITLCQQNNIQEIWFKIVKLLFNQRINKTFINLVNQHKQFLKTESENFYNLMLIE